MKALRCATIAVNFRFLRITKVRRHHGRDLLQSALDGLISAFVPTAEDMKLSPRVFHRKMCSGQEVARARWLLRDGAVQRQLQKLEFWSAALPPVLCNKMSLVECLDACVSRVMVVVEVSGFFIKTPNLSSRHCPFVSRTRNS